MNTGIFSGRPPGEAWLQFRAFVRRVGTELRRGSWCASRRRATCRMTWWPDTTRRSRRRSRRRAWSCSRSSSPTRSSTPRRRRCSRCARGCARGRAGAHPLRRLRPGLLAARRRALRGADPGRRAGGDASRAPATSCRRTRASGSASGSRGGLPSRHEVRVDHLAAEEPPFAVPREEDRHVPGEEVARRLVVEPPRPGACPRRGPPRRRPAAR